MIAHDEVPQPTQQTICRFQMLIIYDLPWQHWRDVIPPTEFSSLYTNEWRLLWSDSFGDKNKRVMEKTMREHTEMTT